jgi:hypothetical protein
MPLLTRRLLARANFRIALIRQAWGVKSVGGPGTFPVAIVSNLEAEKEEAHIRVLFAAVPSLLLLLCAGGAIPAKAQEQHAEITLHPQWTIELKDRLRLQGRVFATGVAVTDAKVVASLEAGDQLEQNGISTILLASFDRKSGSLQKSREIKPKNRISSLQLLEATSKTFLAQEDDRLTEYDEELKPMNRIRLPRGMKLVLQPGVAYGWPESTKSLCELKKPQAYELDGKRKLDLACGYEAGVVDEQWRPIHLERCSPMKALVNPSISRDGSRVVLQYANDTVEPPNHRVISYVLYDLRGGAFHRTTFDLEEKVDPEYVTVSADGTMFALVGRDRANSAEGVARLSMYLLPQ